MRTKEDYRLSISTEGQIVKVSINSTTFFGARHALETLTQLIQFDDLNNELKILSKVEIDDEPKFKHRGLSLDTARNFLSKEAIMKILDTMAMFKMNVLHWSFVDPASFSSEIELGNDEAFTENQIHSKEIVKEIVEFAKMRGIRVIPEFAGPPCSQLDPSNFKIFENKLLRFKELFNTADLLHMGGIEVYLKCWNSSKSLKKWMIEERGWGLQTEDFMRLWENFQEKVLQNLDKVAGSESFLIFKISSKTDLPYPTKYLDKDRSVIQIPMNKDDLKSKGLLESSFKLIISNHDSPNLNCEFSSSSTDGNSSCSSYKSWKVVYDRIKTGENIEQILGAEMAFWNEQVKEATFDSKLWPQAIALAERLWSDPKGDSQHADSRMRIQFKSLKEMGIETRHFESKR
jgi:hexosaminidase